MYKALCFSISALVVTSLLGCGSPAQHGGDGPSSGETPSLSQGSTSHSYSMVVDAGQPLPACDAAAEKSLIYVVAESAFKVCQSGSWAAIEIKGPKGDAGVAGKDGSAGASGKNGTDNHIIASILCAGGLENTDLHFAYSAALMASGDVFADGSISDAAFEIGGTRLYSSKQNGAATAQVLFANDLAAPANGGFWSIKLDRSTLVTMVTYIDADVSGGGAVWTMPPTACVSNKYD